MALLTGTGLQKRPVPVAPATWVLIAVMSAMTVGLSAVAKVSLPCVVDIDPLVSCLMDIRCNRIEKLSGF